MIGGLGLENRFEVRDGAFWLEEKPVMLRGGELHYFRVPRTCWHDRLQKMRDAGCNLVSSYIPWIWHEKQEGFIELRGETTPERNLEAFVHNVAEHGMLFLAKPGPYVMSELQNEGIPGWLLEKYPEVLARNLDGSPHPTRVVSYLHPHYLGLASRWLSAVCELLAPFQVSRGGPMLMWQLDNEVGMLHWVTGKADFSPDTLEHFDRYVQQAFPPERLLSLGVNPSEARNWIERFSAPSPESAFFWQRVLLDFSRHYFQEYLQALQQMVRQNGIEVPLTINVHGYTSFDYAKRGNDYPIGLSQLHDALGMDGIVTGGDYYIGNIVPDNFTDVVINNAFSRAVQNPAQPLFSGEFQGGTIWEVPRLQPTTFDLTTRLCVADGMDGFNYYMFCGGEHFEKIWIFNRRHDWQAPVSADGSLKPHYRSMQALNRALKAIEPELAHKSIPQTLTTLGFIPDDFSTEYSHPLVDKEFQRMVSWRRAFVFAGIPRGLSLCHFPFDAVDLQQTPCPDVSRYPSLWVFSSGYMDAAIQHGLVEYVRNGGQLVLYPTLPQRGKWGEPCDILARWIGVSKEKNLSWAFLDVFGIDNVGVSVAETYAGVEPGEGFAFTPEGECCGFERERAFPGRRKGKMLLAGFGLEVNHAHHLQVVKEMAKRLDILPLTPDNDHLDVRFRKAKEGDGGFVFVNNLDEYDKTWLPQIAGMALQHYDPVYVGARSGVILPVNIPLGEGKTLFFASCELLESTPGLLRFRGQASQERVWLSFTPRQLVPAKGGSRVAADGVCKVTVSRYRMQKLRLVKGNDPFEFVIRYNVEGKV